MNGLAIPTLYGISLFSGIAGLDLGIEHIIPNTRTLCYVEGEMFGAQILHQNMQLGLLHPAPIYSDVVSFPSFAHHFSQKVDFITAGFPCQPFSQAGSRKGTDDHRWLWDSILETIMQTRPSFLFLENVSNLLNEWGAFDEISKSLSKIGFNIEWSNVRASDVGANHQRNRLFIFAYIPSELYRIKYQLSHPNQNFTHSDCDGFSSQKSISANSSERISQEKRISGHKSIKHPVLVTNPDSQRRNTFIKNLRCGQSDSLWKGIKFTHSNSERRKKPNLPKISIKKELFGRQNNEFTNSDHIWESTFSFGNEKRRLIRQPKSNFHPSWWTGNPPFSPVCGVDDGISHGMDRLRALGNAVVPLQASHAFYHLILRGLQHDTP